MNGAIIEINKTKITYTFATNCDCGIVEIVGGERTRKKSSTRYWTTMRATWQRIHHQQIQQQQHQ